MAGGTESGTGAYDPSASDCYKLRVFDTLRGLVARDALTQGLYQGIIRQFPVTTAAETDLAGNLLPPVVSLYSPRAHHVAAVTLGGSGVGRFETVFRGVLVVTLCERQSGADADYMDDLYRRLSNFTDAFQRAVLKYPEDPTPGRTRLWHRLEFPGSEAAPAEVMDRESGVLLRTITQFDLYSQRRQP